MKIEINFKGMESEIVTSITLGTGADKKVITWLHSAYEQNCTRGEKVFINGKEATDEDCDIRFMEITAMRTLDQDTDLEFDFVELFSVSIFLEDGTKYDFPENAMSRFVGVKLQVDGLNLNVLKFQYDQIVEKIRQENRVQNFEDAIECIKSSNRLSCEDAELLLGPLKNTFVELFTGKITDIVTGEDDFIADLVFEGGLHVCVKRF